MKNKVKIAMVGMYPREDGKPRGGPESVAEVLADGLACTGKFEVHIITGVPKIKKPEFRETASGVQIHSVPLFYKFGALTGYFIDRRRLRRKMNEIRPDLVHVHGINFYAYSCLERGYPSVLAIRGIPFKEISHERKSAAIQLKCAAKYNYNALERAKHIICLNRYTSSSCSNWMSTSDIRYIDNPVDDSFFEVMNEEEEGRLILLAVVRRLKGHEFVIRAVAKLKAQGRKVNLYCVGPVFDADYEAELKKLVADEHLEDCVHFEEQASRVKALEHYSRSSIVIVPSLVENAPLVISESMAAGKAIIATPAGGIPEMIEDGKSGLIVPFSDPDALSAAITRLLDSPETRAQMGMEAKKTAEMRFRKSVAVQKTIDFYQDVTGLIS